jgi:hypothetical protein
MALRMGQTVSQSLTCCRNALCDVSLTRLSVASNLGAGRNSASLPRAAAAKPRTVLKSQVKNWLKSAELSLPLICEKYGRICCARQTLSGMSATSLWAPPQSSCCTTENALRLFTFVRLRPKSSFESSSSLN